MTHFGGMASSETYARGAARSLVHTNKPNQMCSCVNTNTHSPHKCTRRCVYHWASLPHIGGREGEKRARERDREREIHVKALIRIWTVTRLVHKLGEIWVGITIWQPAVRNQTSSVISIFSHDSELCDKQHHAASQSVNPSTGNVANYPAPPSPWVFFPPSGK